MALYDWYVICVADGAFMESKLMGTSVYVGRNVCFCIDAVALVHIKCRIPNSQPFSIYLLCLQLPPPPPPKMLLFGGSHPTYASLFFIFTKKHKIRVNTQFIAFRKAIRISNKTNEILMKIYTKNMFVFPLPFAHSFLCPKLR